MSISSGLRNRLLGFAIVISGVIILLPLVLSKDVLQRQDPQAIAVNSQGAIYDEHGNLTYQSSPDLEGVLNIQSGANPNAEQVYTSSRNELPSTNIGDSAANLAEASSDNSVEMLEFSAGGLENQDRDMGRPVASSEEILTAERSEIAVQPKPVTPKEETLTVNSKPVEQTQPPKPPIGNSIGNSAAPTKDQDGSKVIAGTKPKANYTIQVGVFSKKANVDNLVKNISQAGINVYAVEVKTGDRTLYRVYAGSANNRNDLNDELKRIEKIVNAKVRIVAI